MGAEGALRAIQEHRMKEAKKAAEAEVIPLKVREAVKEAEEGLKDEEEKLHAARAKYASMTDQTIEDIIAAYKDWEPPEIIEKKQKSSKERKQKSSKKSDSSEQDSEESDESCPADGDEF